MVTYSFVVEFKDGKRKIINGVKNYLLTVVAGVLFLKIEKDTGYCICINWDEVKYCGRQRDLG